MKIRILLSCIFLITTFSFAQSKKGNIVQYFGKEKVEDINEGSILHLFNDGLLLKGKRFDKIISSFNQIASLWFPPPHFSILRDKRCN